MDDRIKVVSEDHVHAIPEITTWRMEMSPHKCIHCTPDLYPPVPKNCATCACCGVFMWTGKDDPKNEAMLVCERCEDELDRDNPDIDVKAGEQHEH